MASRVCPHCGVMSHFTERGEDRLYLSGEWYRRFLNKCDNCEMPICGVVPVDEDLADDEVVWPKPSGIRDYPDVPEAIGSSANEAHLALAANAARAAVVMARAVIEATAKDKGIKSGSLESKIEQLADQGLISELMRLAADEIRFAGNDAIHGNLIHESISAGDAEDIVSLMDTILERIYQEPAGVERVRANRERRRRHARQSGGDEGSQ